MAPTEILVAAGWVDDGGVIVNPRAVDVTHAPRGTCEPECGLYGRCHCQACDRTPAIATTKNAAREGVVVGRPFVYVRGHNPSGVEAMAAWHRGRKMPPPAGSLPSEKVQPFLDWLEARYGTQVAVARLLGLDASQYSRLRRGRWPIHRPSTWRRIQDLVLAHRTPRDPFATFEERRVIPAAEMARMDREEAARYRRELRYKRLGRPDPQAEEEW